MTLKELQDVLGNNITKVNEDNLEKEETKHRIEIADTTSKLAKQMINNADVILRTDKMLAEGKLLHSTIRGIVG